MTALPEGFLVAWYGDDFTGASAVMEVLSFAGLPAMLFLDTPTEAQLARYPDLQAIGVASTARAQSNDWMDDNLPSAFQSLLALQPQIFHYKICSTLDSSPTIGSIGRAIEIGADLIKPSAVPVLVAAPQMRRYQVFGHLFAGLGDDVYRLDRHPVMARHPVTPMHESDVARHIAAQSKRITASCLSLEEIAISNSPQAATVADMISVFTLDCHDAKSEASAGQLIWEERDTNKFVVGSQGVEFALVRYWVETGALPRQMPPVSVGRAHGMVTVSGSVSPTTAEQIAWSCANGFAGIRFDATKACGSAETLQSEIDRIISVSLDAISTGKDPLIFTAQGPDDPAVEHFKTAVLNSNKSMSEVNENIGRSLGDALGGILEKSGIRRAVISGGDTSGYATQQLGIFALSALAPTIPGASLFKAHAEGAMDGLELALKGGQMGSPDYFGWIRDGGGMR
ncbi:four-carbon acid sugar kinase family protein [Ahrensia kielensis]|uniref:four-carbon acid sugar kinase family protein n=1 Tax=Ahrensia kielensis TaxID=76980 RepID=UPI00039A3CAC|nr:four-carbon acid sugar kinase family protein [Ahrensia kielensis]